MYKNRFLITYILLVISIFISVRDFGKNIESKLSGYVENEVSRVSKILIREVLDQSFVTKLDLKELYYIEKTDSGDIELIDFNAEKINGILGVINDKIISFFDAFERGDIDLLYEARLFGKMKNGIILAVPIGTIFSNPIFSNIGPRIPIKVVFNGDVETNINTEIKQYGINNILLEIDIEIVVVENIIFPFSKKEVEVFFDFPLVIEIISGKVPENYLKS